MRTLLRNIASSVAPGAYLALVRFRSARAAARAEREQWEPRIQDVLACPDNAKLMRVERAGKVHSGAQVMFNGVLVPPDGYYGGGMTELLARNRGSHEPQEELVFSQLIAQLPAGACMVECGAYWGFYSAWFSRDVLGGRAWLIEPDVRNIEVGRRTFVLNGLKAQFLHAFVGSAPAASATPCVQIDDFLENERIDRLDVLHADIQGAELDMLDGAARSLATGRIDHVFVSTHSEQLHASCADRLQNVGYEVIVSITPAQSYSFDGLLVAHRRGLPRYLHQTPSAKPAVQEQSA